MLGQAFPIADQFIAQPDRESSERKRAAQRCSCVISSARETGEHRRLEVVLRLTDADTARYFPLDPRGLRAASRPVTVPGRVPSALDTVECQQGLHAPHSQLRLLQQSGCIGQPEQLGQVHDGARALLPAHHGEVRLVPIEP